MAKPCERCRMVVRQWEVLQQLEAGPKSLDQLAGAVGDGGVTTRTIRRDLEALQAAGFPLYNDRDEDNVVRWRLARRGVTPARKAA